MRILHTADWHLGKTLKGRDRTPEIAKALQELLALVKSERIEGVLVAGDLFDRAQVSPEAEGAALDFFLGLGQLNVPALVIAGNHDSRDRFDQVLGKVLPLTGSKAIGDFKYQKEGGTAQLGSLSVAMFPFLSERRIVRKIMDQSPDLWKGTYAEAMRRLIENLSGGFGKGPNVLMGHWAVEGAKPGGGEFEFYTTNSYSVMKSHLPLSAHYVALGHIHRQQQLSDAPVTWYSGSLIQLDFGDHEEAPRGALIVELLPGVPPKVHPVNQRWGLPLKTFRLTRQTLDQRYQELQEWPGLAKLIIEAIPDAQLRERLHRELPQVLDIEFRLSDNENTPAPLPNLEAMDWSELYCQYHLEQHGQEAVPELLQKFQSVYTTALNQEDA